MSAKPENGLCRVGRDRVGWELHASGSSSCLSPLHYHMSSESNSRETTDQQFWPSQSFAYWYYFFFFFRLDTKSLERASMDYEAPLMPCGCILPLPHPHVLGPRGPGLEPRERARSCGVVVGSGLPLQARGLSRGTWRTSVSWETMGGLVIPRARGVLLGLGQHTSFGSHPPEVTGGNTKDSSWEGPEKLDLTPGSSLGSILGTT